MNLPQDYVLVLDERQRHPNQLDFPATAGRYDYIVASSATHAIETARRINPCLVILVGENHGWLRDQVHALRCSVKTPPLTIVALSESTSPRWLSSKEMPELDGFLVKPLTDDILVSLMQSASIKQSYRQSA